MSQGTNSQCSSQCIIDIAYADSPKPVSVQKEEGTSSRIDFWKNFHNNKCVYYARFI